MVPILRYQVETLARVTLCTRVQSNLHNDPPFIFHPKGLYSDSLVQGGTDYMSTDIARILLRIKNRYGVDVSLRLPW